MNPNSPNQVPLLVLFSTKREYFIRSIYLLLLSQLAKWCWEAKSLIYCSALALATNWFASIRPRSSTFNQGIWSELSFLPHGMLWDASSKINGCISTHFIKMRSSFLMKPASVSFLENAGPDQRYPHHGSYGNYLHFWLTNSESCHAPLLCSRGAHVCT